MTESPTLVSACLLGLACRWDGRSKPAALDLLGPVLPVCPEGAAGFGVPRPAIELTSRDRVRIVATGEDVTDRLSAASARLVSQALGLGVQRALLKERSPSCGVHQTHREGAVVSGSGHFAAQVVAAGIAVEAVP